MKNILFYIVLLLFTTQLLFTSISSKPTFIENKGQWDKDILYSLQGDGVMTNITNDGIYFDFYRIYSEHIVGDVIKMKLENSNTLKVEPINQSSNSINYFIGNDSKSWIKNVGTFEKLSFENVYSGINLELLTDGNSPRYDFIIEPFADPNQIQISFDGINSLAASNKNLVIQTLNSVIENKNLLAYQMKDGIKSIVPCKFELIDNKIGFNLGEYDKSVELVIDPVIYSSYYGGSGDERANIVKFIDDSTFVLAGSTNSMDLRTTVGAYDQEYAERFDAFVSKIKIKNSEYQPEFTTYLGSLEFDEIVDLEIDKDFLLLVGNTESADFPLKDPFVSVFQGGKDIFVSSLGLNGDTLLKSSYFGGSLTDEAVKVIKNRSNQFIIIGSTDSPNIRVLGGPQNGNYKGKKDILIFTVNSDRTSVVLTTHLGGASDDVPYDMFINQSTNNIAITGYTTSITGTDNDFPILPDKSRWFGRGGAYDDSFNGRKDVFVMQLGPNAQTLDVSTYIGSSGDDIGKGVWLSSGDEIYVIGETYNNYDVGLEFPITEGDNKIKGESDIFIAKFNEVRESFGAQTQTLAFSRVIAANGNEEVEDIKITNDGSKFGVVFTNTGEFPEVSFDLYKPGTNIVYTELNDINGDVTSSTLFGGLKDEFPTSLTYDRFDGYMIAGYTFSEDIETTSNASQKSKSNNSDIILVRNNPNQLSFLAPQLNSVLCVGSDISIKWSGNGLSTEDGYQVSYMLNEDPLSITEISNNLNSESYLWTIPKILSGKDSITIRVSHSSGAYAQNSDFFSVNESAKINLFELMNNDTLCIGDSILFEANAVGTGIEYIWYKDDVEVNRSDDNTFKIENVNIDNSGTYKVSVVNECPPESYSENTFSIYVSPYTKAGELPESINKKKGETLELTSDSKGVELMYEWYKDDSVVPSQNGPTLTLSNLSLNDAGNYKCVVIGKCGIDTSNVSTVTIEDVIGNVKQQLNDIAEVNINSDGTVNIEMKNSYLFNLNFYNNDGSLISRINNQSNSYALDLNNRPSGIYWLIVEMNDKLYKHKISYLK